MKLFITLTAAAVALCSGLDAQNRVKFGGEYSAIDYAYGIAANVPGPLLVSSGTTVTGSGTLTLVTSQVTLGDGTTIFPLSTNAPITVDAGANQETVTPTALSNMRSRASSNFAGSFMS